MVPKLTPLAKTAIELRRAILRLETLAETDPMEFTSSGAASVLSYLKGARNAIPERFKDVDIEGRK